MPQAVVPIVYADFSAFSCSDWQWSWSGFRRTLFPFGIRLPATRPPQPTVPFSKTLRFPLYPRLSPSQLRGLLVCRFLSSFKLPPRSAGTILFPFSFVSLSFSLCSTRLYGGFLALFGRLRLSASIQ